MDDTTDDIRSQALNSSHDFYSLLELNDGAVDSEIRRAYRKTALKYHPDKVGPGDAQALQRFYLLQIAYDVLSDPATRELYDNAQAGESTKVRAREGVRRPAQVDERGSGETGKWRF